MPQLFKNIQAEYISVSTGEVSTLTTLSGIIQQEDYVSLFGFVAYLQNFTKTEETELLLKPHFFGLKNRLNLEVKNLKIDY